MCRLTRIAWLVTGPVLLVAAILVVRQKIRPPPPPAVHLQAWADSYVSRPVNARLVQQYVAVLGKHEGKMAAPLADLPATPKEIDAALATAPDWAADWDTVRGQRYYVALALHLHNFVPDPARANPSEIFAMQKASLLSGRFNGVDGIGEYRDLGWHHYSGGETPIRIGHGFEVLTLEWMHPSRRGDFKEVVAWIPLSVLCAIRVNLYFKDKRRQLPGRRRVTWRVVVFVAWCIFGTFFIVVFLEDVFMPLLDVADFGGARWLVYAPWVLTILLLPMTLALTLFDMLFYRPGGRAGIQGASDGNDAADDAERR